MPRNSSTSDPSERRPRVTLNSARHVPYFFTYISNKLSNSASDLYRKHFNLGISEWRIMSVLATMPDLSAHQLSSRLGIDKGAISRSLQKLEKMGLIETLQIKTDNRSKTIRLSDPGNDLHDKIIGVALERERILLSHLTAEEREMFIVALTKVRDALPEVESWEP